MRIAIRATTTTGTTNPLLAQKGTPDSPFSSVLASTAGSSGQMAGATTSTLTKGFTASQEASQTTASLVTSQVASVSGSLLQNGKTQTPTDIDASNTDATAGLSQTPASSANNTSGTVRAASRDEKAPEVPTAAVVNAVPLPERMVSAPQPVTPPVRTSTSPAQTSTVAQPSGQEVERAAPVSTSAVSISVNAGQSVVVREPASGPVENTAPVAAREQATSTRTNEADQNASVRDGAASDSATTNQTGFALPQSLTLATVLPSNMLLPDAGFSASGIVPASVGTTVGKAGQGPASSATNSKVSDAVSGPGTGKSDGAAGSSEAHGTVGSGPASSQNGNQTSGQNAQPTANGAQVTAKSDNGASAMQAIGTAPAVHDAAARRAGDGVGDGPHSSELTAATVPVPRENGESTPTSAINSARLIQTMGETGMQVGMRSAEFGDISIRTSVSQQQMLAQISVDHGDLGKAIAAHLPAIEAKLGDEFGLRASIQVNHSGASLSGERGNTSPGEQRSYARSVQNESASADIESMSPGIAAAAWDGNRLDVRA